MCNMQGIGHSDELKPHSEIHFLDLADTFILNLIGGFYIRDLGMNLGKLDPKVQFIGWENNWTKTQK